MNRRNFIKMSLLFPLLVFPTKTQVENIVSDTFENGLVFPFYFPYNVNQVEIVDFKAKGFFSQLWQELSQFTK